MEDLQKSLRRRSLKGGLICLNSGSSSLDCHIREVLDLVILSIEGAMEDGGMVPADMEARSLLEAHPDCQIPFEELRDAIARMAVEKGVGVEFGFRPDEISN
jgi:hypothetical protein